jgi:hypothetical protein
MGILDFLSSLGPQGMLGGPSVGGSADGGYGILNSLTQTLQNNQNAFGALGAGLMSGQPLRDAFSQGAQGFVAGRQVDKKLLEEAQKKAALAKFLAGSKLSPEAQALATADPEIGQSLAINQLAPKSDTFGVVGENADGSKQYGFINSASHSVTPFGNPSSAAAAPYPGKTVDAAALNRMVQSGQMTQQQADMWAAGRPLMTPDGPVYMTPEAFTRGAQPGGQTNTAPTPQATGNPAPATGAQPSPAQPTVPQVNANPAASGDAVPGIDAPLAWEVQKQRAATPGMVPLGGAQTKAPTESVMRNRQIYLGIARDAKDLDSTFNALQDERDWGASQVPLIGNYATSGKFQQAQKSVENIVQNYLYSLSGASAPAEEVRKRADAVTPRPGDKPRTVAAKKQRLKDMVASVYSAANGGQGTPGLDSAPLPEDAPTPGAPTGGARIISVE